MALVVFNIFVSVFYYIDENNLYQRAPLFFTSYLLPFAALVLMFSLIYQYRNKLGRGLCITLLLFAICPIVAAVFQFYAYGLSLVNITISIMAIILYFFAFIDMNKTVERARTIEIDYLKREQKDIQLLFEQTAEALASAIDAKDKYTHGHSNRVADYSRRIAELAGKDEKECEEIYFAALLHDVGKIGVPDFIITKDGKLTDEEFAEIKQHPVIGKQILASINKSPYLSIGAHYHHERYDGKGYPAGLKGDDIPEIARIIAVADSYDAMTSKRSYRDPLSQDKVREELVKGIGNQFDPQFAKLMLHLIDIDSEYELKEKEDIAFGDKKTTLTCDELRSDVLEGIAMTPYMTRIRLNCKSDPDHPGLECIPTMVIFDALDNRYHYKEDERKEMVYFEYGEVRFDGKYEVGGARKIMVDITENKKLTDEELIEAYRKGIDYEIESSRYLDHGLIKITSRLKTIEMVIAFPDNTRYSYIGLTGEHCRLSNVDAIKAQEKIAEDYIPRIAEPVSYIDGPVGDIPNVQVDGWCSAATDGVPIKDNMKIIFHTMSLPTARLIWHCPYIRLFYSKDRKVNGEDFRDFVLIRLDGETWDSDDRAENKMQISKNDDFNGWDTWKELNKKGMICKVIIRKKGNKITVITENGGIYIKSTTTINIDVPEVYVSLSGDQVALTDIHIG
ncbi:MAG: HD domain-containing protein [Lachnospiraceae bacterium]|nr:HD domain-containing protein [Lachnospiraceae bacterium]